MATWNRFWSLNRHERRAALEAAAAITASKLGLRLFEYSRWVSLLSRLSPIRTNHSADRPLGRSASNCTPERLARLAEGVARRLLFHPTCLERSLGLWWILRRRGFDAEIRIGGRKRGNGFEAHAWVEYVGTVLNDVGDDHGFSVFHESQPAVSRRTR